MTVRKLILRIRRSHGWRLFKRGALIAFMALCGLGLSMKSAVPMLRDSATKSSNVSVSRNFSGEIETKFKNDAVPQGYRDELNFPAEQVVYTNQERASRHEGSGEDDPDPAVIPKDDKRQIIALAKGFLGDWETFDADGDVNTYRANLAKYVDPSGLDAVAHRRDSIQNPAIAIGGNSGSASTDRGADIEGFFTPLRYDGETAYVATIGSVVYTGPSLAWSGREFRRAYSLVLRRNNGRWVIARAVAQTLGETIG